MKRTPSKRIFLTILALMLVVMIIAGYLSGSGGLAEGSALIVALVLLLAFLPLLFKFAPRGFFGKWDKSRP